MRFIINEKRRKRIHALFGRTLFLTCKISTLQNVIEMINQNCLCLNE